MKRLIAVLLLVVLSGALLCACGEADVEPTEFRNHYPGKYVFENNTIRERSSRVLIINPDGSYTYDRISTLPWVNGSFTGTWTINEAGYILLRADESGLISKGMLSEDTMLLNVSDLQNGDDTVGDGIYRYIIPDNQATPDAG